MEQSIYQLSSKHTNLPLPIRSTYKSKHGFSEDRQIAYHEPVAYNLAWPKRPVFLAVIIEYANLFLPQGLNTCYSLCLTCSFPHSWTNYFLLNFYITVSIVMFLKRSHRNRVLLFPNQ